MTAIPDSVLAQLRANSLDADSHDATTRVKPVTLIAIIDELTTLRGEVDRLTKERDDNFTAGCSIAEDRETAIADRDSARAALATAEQEHDKAVRALGRAILDTQRETAERIAAWLGSKADVCKHTGNIGWAYTDLARDVRAGLWRRP